MAGGTERDHQLQNGPSRHAVMHDDGSLVPARGSTQSAAVPVALQDHFTKAAEVRFILPAERVADGTHAICQNTLAPASAVHHPLSALLHTFAPGSPLSMYLYIVSRITPSYWASSVFDPPAANRLSSADA
jgi:hypothetical protein